MTAAVYVAVELWCPLYLQHRGRHKQIREVLLGDAAPARAQAAPSGDIAAPGVMSLSSP